MGVIKSGFTVGDASLRITNVKPVMWVSRQNGEMVKKGGLDVCVERSTAVREWLCHYVSGDLEILIVGWKLGKVPVGIVTDRIEEYPNELKAFPERRELIIQWLRAKYPNGV
jgi:hypothetical protein